jgi:hypothetical protein
VQALAAAVSTHVHDGAGKGLLVGGPAAGSITNAMLGADVARDNLLGNGGFEQWQRGTGPFTGGGAYGADRWVSAVAGSDTLSTSKATSPNVDVGSAASAGCTFVLSGGGGTTQLKQSLQAINDNTGLPGRTLSVSVRVRTSTPSAVRIALNNYYGSASHYTYSGYHSGGGGWETLTVTAALDPTATYCEVVVFFNASCTAYLDNAMLVVGSQAANYVPLHPADDLARCLRYYEVVGALQNEIVAQAYGVASGAYSVYYGFKARKAITPTFTKNGTWVVTNCGQPAVASGAVDSVTLSTTVTALGALQFSNNAVGANVVMEANP